MSKTLASRIQTLLKISSGSWRNVRLKFMCSAARSVSTEAGPLCVLKLLRISGLAVLHASRSAAGIRAKSGREVAFDGQAARVLSHGRNRVVSLELRMYGFRPRWMVSVGSSNVA